MSETKHSLKFTPDGREKSIVKDIVEGPGGKKKKMKRFH